MGGAGVASAGMCGPRLKVDGQHGEATREVCDGYVGRTSGTMRAGGKGDASSLCGKVCSSNGTSVRRVIVER
jgi:expansin (peptidoglycan-binding protein)